MKYGEIVLYYFASDATNSYPSLRKPPSFHLNKGSEILVYDQAVTDSSDWQILRSPAVSYESYSQELERRPGPRRYKKNMANLFGRLLYRESGFIFRESKTVGFFQDSNRNGNLPLRRFLNRDPVRCIRGLTFQIKGGSENSEENDHQDRESSLLGVYNSGYDSNRKQESKDSKLLRVAIIGEANSGKSTLTNCLTGHKICAVTAVPHTTRKQTLGVCMMGDSQIVLLDTPGVVTRGEARRLKMSRQHVLAPRQALEEADLIDRKSVV